MMRLDVRLSPWGDQDLAWLAEVASSLHDIYSFVAFTVAEERVAAGDAGSRRRLTEEQLRTAVELEVAKIGTPRVKVRAGSVILELAEFLNATTPVQILAGFGALLKYGPDALAVPQQVRKRWYQEAGEAELARKRYRELTESTHVEVLEDDEDLPELLGGLTEGGARGKTSGVLDAAVDKVEEMLRHGGEEDEADEADEAELPEREVRPRRRPARVRPSREREE
jgi:hypothetical protein